MPRAPPVMIATFPRSIAASLLCPSAGRESGRWLLRCPRPGAAAVVGRRGPRPAQAGGGRLVDRQRRRVEDNAVQLAGRSQRDVALAHVALHPLGGTLERAAVAPAAARVEDVGLAAGPLQVAHFAVREDLGSP